MCPGQRIVSEPRLKSAGGVSKRTSIVSDEKPQWFDAERKYVPGTDTLKSGVEDPSCHTRTKRLISAKVK